jgi:hypothetical protein|tara:strand:- start:289 stop:414 length:126 start_codon:yes stop_codon:yes gene_type:complete
VETDLVVEVQDIFVGDVNYRSVVLVERIGVRHDGVQIVVTS